MEKKKEEKKELWDEAERLVIEAERRRNLEAVKSALRLTAKWREELNEKRAAKKEE